MTKVCLIDDDDIVRSAMEIALGDCGYEVKTIGSSAAALAAIEADQPDVVMTDMKMPGLDGAGLIKVIREKFPILPIVAMSGDMAEEDGVSADVFLHKPFKMRDARAAIEQALKARRA